MTHVGTLLEDRTVQAVAPSGKIVTWNLHEHFKGSWGVLFFYPLNFTFVCPTEILAFDAHLEQFEQRNVKVAGVSVDSVHAHQAWRSLPKEEGGIGPVRFPLISDLSRALSQSFGILHDGEKALRATYLIDPDGRIQHESINYFSIGRNVEEILRIVDAAILTRSCGQVCPAQWKKGEEGFHPTPQGLKNYLGR